MHCAHVSGGAACWIELSKSEGTVPLVALGTQLRAARPPVCVANLDGARVTGKRNFDRPGRPDRAEDPCGGGERCEGWICASGEVTGPRRW